MVERSDTTGWRAPRELSTPTGSQRGIATTPFGQRKARTEGLSPKKFHFIGENASRRCLLGFLEQNLLNQKLEQYQIFNSPGTTLV